MQTKIAASQYPVLARYQNKIVAAEEVVSTIFGGVIPIPTLEAKEQKGHGEFVLPEKGRK
jgi:hypothetical protein